MGRGPREEVVGSVARSRVVAATNGREVAVRPGILDDAALDVYCNGQCAALAVALQEELGGKVIAIGYDDSSEDVDQWRANPSYDHCGLELDNGRVVDVNDVYSDVNTWMEINNCWEARNLSNEEALALPNYPAQDVETARTMVAPLRAQLDV